eukprot:gene5482-6646_t
MTAELEVSFRTREEELHTQFALKEAELATAFQAKEDALDASLKVRNFNKRVKRYEKRIQEHVNKEAISLEQLLGQQEYVHKLERRVAELEQDAITKDAVIENLKKEKRQAEKLKSKHHVNVKALRDQFNLLKEGALIQTREDTGNGHRSPVSYKVRVLIQNITDLGINPGTVPELLYLVFDFVNISLDKTISPSVCHNISGERHYRNLAATGMEWAQSETPTEIAGGGDGSTSLGAGIQIDYLGFKTPTTPCLQLPLPIQQPANHTAACQFKDLTSGILEVQHTVSDLDLCNAGAEKDICVESMKIHMGDHASDVPARVKLIGDSRLKLLQYKYGESIYDSMPEDDRCSQVTTAAWAQVTEEILSVVPELPHRVDETANSVFVHLDIKGLHDYASAVEVVIQELGALGWSCLSKEEQDEAVVLGLGCSSHKIDNCLKHLDTAFASIRERHVSFGIPPPILLPNIWQRGKELVATQSDDIGTLSFIGSTDRPADRSTKKIRQGGIELLELLCIALANPDPKATGCQQGWRDFVQLKESETGESWPKLQALGSARYHEKNRTCGAAWWLRDKIREFLEHEDLVQDKMGNLNLNLYNGLRCKWSLCEMAASYIIYYEVGFGGLSVKNDVGVVWEMSDKYDGVVGFLEKCIDDPNILLTGFEYSTTIQILETLKRFAEDQLPGGKHHIDNIPEVVRERLPQARPDNDFAESVIGQTKRAHEKMRGAKMRTISTVVCSRILKKAIPETMTKLAGMKHVSFYAMRKYRENRVMQTRKAVALARAESNIEHEQKRIEKTTKRRDRAQEELSYYAGLDRCNTLEDTVILWADTAMKPDLQKMGIYIDGRVGNELREMLSCRGGWDGITVEDVHSCTQMHYLGKEPIEKAAEFFNLHVENPHRVLDFGAGFA